MNQIVQVVDSFMGLIWEKPETPTLLWIRNVVETVTAALFTVLDYDGTEYLVPLNVLDYDGTEYVVSGFVKDSDGTDYGAL